MFFRGRLSSFTGVLAGFFVFYRNLHSSLLSVALAVGFFVFPASALANGLNEFFFSFPYSVRTNAETSVSTGSTGMAYIAVTASFPDKTDALLKVELPDVLQAVSLPEGWQSGMENGRNVITKTVSFAPFYDFKVELLPILTKNDTPEGEYALKGSIEYKGKKIEKTAAFNVAAADAAGEWTIRGITVPVNKEGQRDDKEKENLLYINDWSIETLRSFVSGRGAVNLDMLESHPVAYMRADIDNPSLDRQVVHFKAELVDRDTGEVVRGLRQPHSQDDESIAEENEHSSQVLASLSGEAKESFIVPLYAEEDLAPGRYVLRSSVNGGGRSLVVTNDIEVVARRNSTTFVLLLGFVCTVGFAVYFWQGAKKWLAELGPRGVITVALFSAVSFGGITLPTTFLEDFLKVFFGPFYPFFTGLLTSSFYYLLLISLFLLYPVRGTAALWVVLRWLLGALLLGRITPVGIMLSCVQAVALEAAFAFFYKKGWSEGSRQRTMLAVGMALSDCLATFVKLELMMFFYRLYYADWYIAVYVVICGFFYTALGSWLGYSMGLRLRNVTGE